MSVIKGKTFVDTNVLVYAFDAQDPVKQLQAAACIESLWQDNRGVISLQVLQECYITLTRKVKKPLSFQTAKTLLLPYAQWEVISLSPDDFFAAIEWQSKFSLSFWDALIVQAAFLAECQVLLTEDLQHGMKFGKLTVHNPFLE